MKSITAGLALASLAICAMSCQKQANDTIEVGSTPIEVDGQMEAHSTQMASRVNGTSFDPGDRISFYAVKYSGSVANLLGGDNNTYLSNKLYERDVDLFRSSDGAGTFNREFYPNDGSSIDIYGIYPYNATKPTSFTAHTFAVQTDQSATDMSGYNACDLMVAKTVKIAPTATPQKLIFNHMMSKIDLNISLVGFASTVNIARVSFVNIKTQATINLQAFDPQSPALAITSSDLPSNITPLEVTAKSGYDKSYTIIAPTQSLAKDAIVAEIVLNTANQDKYILTLGSAITLSTGLQHTFDIKISFGEQHEISTNPTIDPWTTSQGAAHGGKISDNQFVMSLTSPTTQISSAAWVKVGVNGDRTFTLKASHSQTAGAGSTQALVFEFPGQGNRPMEFPYTISSFQVLDANELAITQKVVIGSPVSIVEADRSETIPIALNYNMSNGTISR